MLSIEYREFTGPHPTGLVGTHIHFLDPVDAHKTVWHINYQDLLAVGKLFTSGRLHMDRVISLAGPLVKNPRLIRTRLGVNIEDLVKGELERKECRIISGSVLSGRRAAAWANFLGRYHNQVTVLQEGGETALSRLARPWVRRLFSHQRVCLFVFQKTQVFIDHLAAWQPKGHDTHRVLPECYPSGHFSCAAAQSLTGGGHRPGAVAGLPGIG